MRFVYQYRTSGNELREGVISATDREGAFRALHSRGIRPARLTEAPGVLNKVLGKGKRWLAIFVLTMLCISLVFAFWKERTVALNATPELEVDERQQLYGDPAVLKVAYESGWRNVLSNQFDCMLAAFAVPGKSVSHSVTNGDFVVDLAAIPVSRDDLKEVAQMKRMVNGMKQECARYLSAGGSISGYVERLMIRQKAEWALYERACNELRLTDDAEVWRTKNSRLRAMGLPMVYFDDDEKSL